MKGVKLLSISVLLAVSATCGVAWADRGHFHGRGGVGIFVGPGWLWPWYYPPSYYYPYYPPGMVIQAPPAQYIEQEGGQAPPAPEPSYWYFCTNPQGYYPYVRECPAGWRKVLPQPPSQQ